MLFYAADDDRAAAAIERLITASGFDPLRAGGVNEAGRIEVPGGDLHQGGGLGGKLLDADQAATAVAGLGSHAVSVRDDDPFSLPNGRWRLSRVPWLRRAD